MDYEFNAGPFITQNKPNELKKFLKSATEDDFGLCVTFLHPEDGTPSINFDLSHASLKKGGVFKWTLDEVTERVVVVVRGELATGPLRSGVAPTIASKYAGAKLRLDSFIFKGGEWSGFRAPLLGQTEENCHSWYVVDDWRVK